MSESTNSLTDESIRTSLRPYGCVPTPGECDALRLYVDLLLRWNQRIPLTTVVDPREILRFHVGESVSAIRLVPISEGRLADVGSGAGFPGAILALFANSLNVTLIESNSKKATFLSEVQRALRLTNMTIFRGRFEEFEPPAERFDFITSRALGSYENLLSWSASVLNLCGLSILWVGQENSRVISQSAGWSWRKTRELPGSRNRILLIGHVSAPSDK